jgi:plasmid stabilization system protein ParE
MPKAFEEVTKDVMELPVHQRLALAEFLIESAEGAGDPDSESAWGQEITERIQAVDQGMVVGTPYEDVMRAARAVPSVTVRFVEEARDEFLDAVSYYEEARNGLGMRFANTVERSVLWIADHPELYRVRPKGFRRINVRGFPYYIAYIVRDQILWVGSLWLTRVANLTIGSPGAMRGGDLRCSREV